MFLDLCGRRFKEAPIGQFFYTRPDGTWRLSPELPSGRIQQRFEELKLKQIQSLFGSADEFWDALEGSNFNDVHGGIDPESTASAEEFREYSKTHSTGTTGKLLYYYTTMQYNHSAQEALNEIEILLGDIYFLLSEGNIQHPIPLEDQLHRDGRSVRNCASSITIRIWSMVSTIILRVVSLLDYTTKYLYELLRGEYRVASSKPKSASKTFGDLKTLGEFQNTSLLKKAEKLALLFSLRDEVVHNGILEPWSRVYEVTQGPKVVERFFLMPDHSLGGFARVGARRRFYSQDRRLNEELPELVRGILVGVSECLDRAETIIPDEWPDPSAYFARHREVHDTIESAARFRGHSFIKFISPDD